MNTFLIALASLAASAMAVKSYLMLPLDTCSTSGLNPKYNFPANFRRIRDEGHFSGIMVDVWWGLTEPQPEQYDFSCYTALAGELSQAGLEMHAVASFHACGGNIGDAVNIPIPAWARDAVRPAHGFYVDMNGQANEEYIGLHADELRILPGSHPRTPINAYQDWAKALRRAMGPYLGTTFRGIEIGMGPAGELRYPSYRVSTFPNLGEFQCYDNHSIAEFKADAAAAGHPEWDAPPRDVCDNGYDCMPEQSRFIKDGLNSDYGRFFIRWYSLRLFQHGERVLSAVHSVFRSMHDTGKMEYAVKIAGIHWLMGDVSHAAELTAGYPNCGYKACSGYSLFANLCNKYGAGMDITCVEKFDGGEPDYARARPGSLVHEIADSVVAAGKQGFFSGENALPCTDKTSLGHVYEKYTYAKRQGAALGTYTHLRWNDDIFNNLGNFREFNDRMMDLD